MPSSTLTPDNLPAGRDRRTGRGHGTEALGPSDSSDTGSDLVGAHGLGDDIPDELEESNVPGPATAGPDVGDAELDSDSDRMGTGERGDATRDAVNGGDIHADRIEKIRPDDEA